MMGFVSLGSNDIQAGGAFYDALLSELGWKRFEESEGEIVWRPPVRGTMLILISPFNKETATSGNGQMTSFMAASEDQVDALHAKALSLGATDEGAPGKRSEIFYASYFRDLDGNKICFGKFAEAA